MSDVLAVPAVAAQATPRCDSRAGAGRFEWVVMFSDGSRTAMFGGRFFIPPHSEVIAIIRRDVLNGPNGQKLLEASRTR